MWEAYRPLVGQYARLSRDQERRLIRRAQRGCQASVQELVLRHVGFAMFRLRERVYPSVLRRLGDDLLSELLVVLHDKIGTYDLRYRGRDGRPKPVKFCSYVWKRLDGHIIDAVNREWREAPHGDMDRFPGRARPDESTG